MNFEFLKFWKNTPSLSPSVTIGKNFTLGPWTRIGSWSKIGNNVDIGLWTKIGRNTVVGNNVHLGNWVHLGDNVIIGDGSFLPGHVRVQDNSIVLAQTIFNGHELVTPTSVILNRCSGNVAGRGEYSNGDPNVSVSCISGKYLIPGYIEDANQMLEDFMDGKCYRIVKYKIG